MHDFEVFASEKTLGKTPIIYAKFLNSNMHVVHLFALQPVYIDKFWMHE